jgi:hypothetical protein
MRLYSLQNFLLLLRNSPMGCTVHNPTREAIAPSVDVTASDSFGLYRDSVCTRKAPPN